MLSCTALPKRIRAEGSAAVRVMAEPAASSIWQHLLCVQAAYAGTAHLEAAWRMPQPDIPLAWEVDAMLIGQVGWELRRKVAVAVESRTKKQAINLQLPPHGRGMAHGPALAYVRPWGLRRTWMLRPGCRLCGVRLPWQGWWEVQWENVFKEPMCSLAVDGFPYHGR